MLDEFPCTERADYDNGSRRHGRTNGRRQSGDGRQPQMSSGVVMSADRAEPIRGHVELGHRQDMFDGFDGQRPSAGDRPGVSLVESDGIL